MLGSILVLIALAAPRYGADSRDVRRRPFYTATLAEDLRRLFRRRRRSSPG